MISSCKSNNHTITAKTAPCYFFNPLKIQDGRHGSDWQRHFFWASFPELLHVTSTDLLEMFPSRSVFQLMLWVRISIRARCTKLCDKVCQWVATGRWYSLGPPISSSNKTDTHDLADILLKVALNTIKPTKTEPNNYSEVLEHIIYRAGTAYPSRAPWFTPRFVVLDR
jgi:hypothetical protein